MQQLRNLHLALYMYLQLHVHMYYANNTLSVVITKTQLNTLETYLTAACF